MKIQISDISKALMDADFSIMEVVAVIGCIEYMRDEIRNPSPPGIAEDYSDKYGSISYDIIANIQS